MSGHNKQRPTTRRGWRRWALGTGGFGAVAVTAALGWWRTSTPPVAQAAPPAASRAQAPAPPPPGSAASSSSDYHLRVVAYLAESPITRAELGEYLIARRGVAKLELLINKRIIEKACQENGVEVTGAEVEAELADTIKGLNISRGTFVKDVLKGYHKNLYEWKEDVVRPKLLLTKLSRSQATVSDEEAGKLYETRYGEKVQCRLILWPLSEKDGPEKLEEAQKQATEVYARVRNDEEAFDRAARDQSRKNLAATAGKVKPIARHLTHDDALERAAFSLRPGEVSSLTRVQDGIVIIKCDARLPADTTVNFEAVKPVLVKDLLDKKVAEQIPAVFKRLKDAANEQNLLKDQANPDGSPPDARVVATIYDNIPITREELGEFLIARYGAETLELLINKRIVDQACQARGIVVTPEEVEAAFAEDLKTIPGNMDRSTFVKEVLKPQGKTLYEWLEDGVRPRLQMHKLVRDSIQPTADDLARAFEAYHGEKVECRIILWRKGEEKTALLEYPRIRDSEQEFDWKAKHQASEALAARGGRLDRPVTRNSTGDPELEREAFALQPGDVSSLIGTPYGTVVIKCDQRIPADDKVKLEDVRETPVKEVIQRKIVQEVPIAFQKLRDEARPKQLLRDYNQAEDLAAEVRSELGVKDADDKHVPEKPASESVRMKGN
jgi:parvulin-like peptidyl-prolyl isomerase